MVEAGKRSTLGGWESYPRLADQIHQAWPADKKTQDVLDEIRG